MDRFMKRVAAVAAFAGVAALAHAAVAFAHVEQSGDIHIIHPWVQPGVSGEVKAFLTISNEGKTPVALVRAETPVARITKIFRDGKEVSSVRIAPEEVIAGEEKGLHFRLVDIRRPLREGDLIPVILHFANGHDRRMMVRVVVGENTEMPHMPEMPDLQNMPHMPGMGGAGGGQHMAPMHDPSQMPMGGGRRP